MMSRASIAETYTVTVAAVLTPTPHSNSDAQKMRPPSKGVRRYEKIKHEERDVNHDRFAAEVGEERVALERQRHLPVIGRREEYYPHQALGNVRQRPRDGNLQVVARVAVVADVRETSQWPEQDLPHLPPHVPGGEAVPELVHEHGA
jgi:hypothetical protein